VGARQIRSGPHKRKASGRPVPIVLLSSYDPAWEVVDLQDSFEKDEVMRVALTERGHEVVLLRVKSPREIPARLAVYDPRLWIVLNWCETFAGMSNGFGLAPQILDRLGFTYTGSGMQTLNATQSKARTLRKLSRVGVPVGKWRLLHSADNVRWSRFPAFVKPSEEHSSIGITRDSVVFTLDELKARVAYVTNEVRGPVLVCDYLTGREFNVAIWGNGIPEILPIHELDFSYFDDPRDRLCSFDAKWVPGSLHWEKIPSLCPAPVHGRLKRRIEEVALSAYQVMGCRDYGRIDLREHGGEIYVIDVNANCDITNTGGFARSARIAGYDYGAAIAHIVELAAVRHHAQREATVRAYEHELTSVPEMDMGVITAV
jgi:D-alanine-D-alanine ligase